ncbi:MAG: phosphatidate cytidylyltransferase [Pirellulales bacterium]|nr:phosphatidate cytidylyltransferase [Pirellulales bacterium]
MLDARSRARLFDYEHALDQPFTFWVAAALAVLLVVALVVIAALRATERIGAESYRELMRRTQSWCVLVPLLLAPVLAGAFWTISGIAILGIFSFREFARVVGLAAETRVMWCVQIAIVLVALASLDHWYAFFMALVPLGAVAIAAVAILNDQPKGYVLRVALGVWGFLLFGSALAHLGYLANDWAYRPIIILVVLSVELNDIFAYCCGKLFGHHKLAPQTSPNKTVAGALGALALTTLVVSFVGRMVFAEAPLNQTPYLIGLGLTISLLGQLGDLMLSSVKRDVGVKDMGELIPGHGGLLDRFDSLLLVAPAVFHYVNYFRGVGMNEPTRIFF